MPVLSNNGRLISSLPVTSTVTGQDEFLLQSSGVTKRINYAALSSSILSSTNFSPFNATVNFTSTQNKFTGSFYNPDFKSSNFYTVNVRDDLTVVGSITTNEKFIGNLTGSVYDTNSRKFTKLYVQQQLTASKADLLQVKIEGGTINGTTIGFTTPTTVKGTTITATSAFVGSLTGNVTGNLTGNVTGNITSTGTSTFSSIDVNGGTIDGATIGASSATTVRGTTITATTGFVGTLTGNVTGNVTGNLTGDVYNSTSTKVLESGNTTPTANGGVASAAFYGTSSYANQALTAAYASSGGSAINGVPIGGNQYQILAKNTNTNYDVIWTTPLSASTQGSNNYVTVWSGAKTVKDVGNFYYNPSGPSWTLTVPLLINGGLYVVSGGITGSLKSLESLYTVSSLNESKFIDGINYSSNILQLSQSGNVTMSLVSGQTSTVLVKNSGAFSVTHWSGSLNGTTANTKIYWKSGVEPSVTSGNLKQDVFTFVNINSRIYGSAIQNFS